MTMHHSNTDYEPSEQKVCSNSGLTSEDDVAISHMSDIPLWLPASANVSFNNSALVTFSHKLRAT